MHNPLLHNSRKCDSSFPCSAFNKKTSTCHYQYPISQISYKLFLHWINIKKPKTKKKKSEISQKQLLLRIKIRNPQRKKARKYGAPFGCWKNCTFTYYSIICFKDDKITKERSLGLHSAALDKQKCELV